MPIQKIKNIVLRLGILAADLGGRTFRPKNKLAKLFALEGIVVTLIIILGHNNNNLYASRLGATASDLGLLASLPPLVGMCLLIPFALFTDRLKNKRPMVIASVIGWTVIYVLVGLVAFLPGNQIPVLIGLLIAVNAPMSLYNMSWQAFFSDVVSESERNEVYSHRTRMNTAIAMVFPLLVGAILTLASGKAKITVHQIYYWLTFPLALIQVYFMLRIQGGNLEKTGSLRLTDIKSTAVGLFKNRKFIGFLAVALLVYSGWEMDWSLNFIAQFNYLKLNEAQLNMVAVLCALTQFLTLGLWSRLVTKKGVRFVLFIGAAGFTCGALVMLITLLLPEGIRIPFYFVFLGVSNSTFSAFQISILQCLLEVIPKANRALTISIYSTLILITNIVMPYLGVFLYTSGGKNKEAIIATFVIITLIRLFAAGAAFLRWFWLRKERED